MFKQLFSSLCVITLISSYTKVYPCEGFGYMEIPIEFREIQDKITRIKEDSLAKILLKNSRLTEIQLETLLIDVLAEESADKRLGYEEKSRIRATKTKISRGAFNRTLKQAKRNVVCSIYTIFLLGYLGILDTPTLNPFVETSNKLKEYMKEYNDLWKESKTKNVDKVRLDSVSLMRKELESSLFELLPLKSLKKPV